MDSGGVGRGIKGGETMTRRLEVEGNRGEKERGIQSSKRPSPERNATTLQVRLETDTGSSKGEGDGGFHRPYGGGDKVRQEGEREMRNAGLFGSRGNEPIQPNGASELSKGRNRRKREGWTGRGGQGVERKRGGVCLTMGKAHQRDKDQEDFEDIGLERYVSPPLPWGREAPMLSHVSNGFDWMRRDIHQVKGSLESRITM